MVKRHADLSKLAGIWENERKLRMHAARGQAVFASTVAGQTQCSGNLKDCSENFEALMCILKLMHECLTVETPPIDGLSDACKEFLEMANFPDKSALLCFAHRDAWSAKRCLTFLRRKWARNEIPKDEKVKKLVAMYDSICEAALAAGHSIIRRESSDDDISIASPIADAVASNSEPVAVETGAGPRILPMTTADMQANQLFCYAGLVQDADVGEHLAAVETEASGSSGLVAMETEASGSSGLAMAVESRASESSGQLAIVSEASGSSGPPAMETEASGSSGRPAMETEASGSSGPVALTSEASEPSGRVAMESEASASSGSRLVATTMDQRSRSKAKVVRKDALCKDAMSSQRQVARPLLADLEAKLAMSRAKLKAQLVKLCCDMICSLRALLMNRMPSLSFMIVARRHFDFGVFFYSRKRHMAKTVTVTRAVPEVIADSDDDGSAPPLECAPSVSVDNQETLTYDPDTQALMEPLWDEEKLIMAMNSGTASPPKPRELFPDTSAQGSEAVPPSSSAKVNKEHKFMALSPPSKVLTRSDQLALKSSNAAADDDEQAEPKKRGPGRPRGKARAGPKASAKAKAKGKAKAKASSSKGAKKASEASEAPVAESTVLTPALLAEESAWLEAEPNDQPRGVRTRRGGFKKRRSFRRKSSKEAKKVKCATDAVPAESADNDESAVHAADDADGAPAGDHSGGEAAKAKASPKGKAKASPKGKAKASPKAKAKANPKAGAKASPKAKAEANPKSKANVGPKAKAKARGCQAIMENGGALLKPDGSFVFDYPKTFAGRFCPKTEQSQGWHLWRYIARSFIEFVAPNIRDRTRSKKELEYWTFAKKNFVDDDIDIFRPGGDEFFAEQAQFYVRDFILRFEVYKIGIWMGQFGSRFSLKDFRNRQGKYPRGLATRLVQVFRYLQLDLPPVPVRVDGSTARACFSGATYSDDCGDANLREVVHYLYGCRGLRIPAEWRPLIPTDS
ncbi:unnamed protein product [Symbiodinium sp. CCMP2592]|nr:unnamed protein product [Symbiodinium sp. CCMP2592]